VTSEDFVFIKVDDGWPFIFVCFDFIADGGNICFIANEDNLVECNQHLGIDSIEHVHQSIFVSSLNIERPITPDEPLFEPVLSDGCYVVIDDSIFVEIIRYDVKVRYGANC